MTATNNFSVLSYNVAGLPALFSSGNPAVNSVDMGKRISDWDIVNVQEDFNYHADLYLENTHKYRTLTSGGVLFGSGLNTLANFPLTNVTNIERVEWNECSTFQSADCLTPKGFTLVEVELADGVTIDVYNLHADAGDSRADLKDRASNLQQLSDFMTINSADNAVIVMGDTNTRYTRKHDTIYEFTKTQNLTDAWVESICKGSPPKKGAEAILCDNTNMTNKCEVVDKIMYRGNNLIHLKLEKWKNENKAFLHRDGSPLSDHPPVSSNFSYTLNPDIRLSRAFGGPHGTRFTDIALATSDQTVSSISIRADKHVDGLTLKISDPAQCTLTHGGTGGTLTKLVLKPMEYITSMEVHWGKKRRHTRIFFVKFMTSKDRTIQGGTPTSESSSVHAPKGFQISGFHGRSGENIYALGAVFTRIDSSR